ncbi:UDP-GalNAc:beta-1,3-N-acetylgalactosaminyltransferase 1-like [Gordionus sp. m RMFG-2023]|uniref:UDP-GalNAc:beta-1, 3-N-acetylgalactosaminyltransferase 1-like n=1 Tax=Gordionus sp. m RMFG-2023 TaxID=3053472 RepID=UPI0031FD0F65
MVENDEKDCCAGNCTSIYILALIISSWNNFRIREVIRDTWAFNGNISVENRTHYVRHVFIVGQAPYNSSLSEQENISSQLKLESEIGLFQDILKINIMDTYANLTYKTMSGITFALMRGIQNKISPLFKSSCFKRYLLKIDDDTLPNLASLIETLLNYHENLSIINLSMSQKDSITSPVFICNVVGRELPIRDHKHKNFLSSSDYPPSKLPPFCRGSAYLLSYHLRTLENMCIMSRLSNYIANEDVYVTGMLSQLLNISMVNIGHAYYTGHYPANISRMLDYRNYIFMTHVHEIHDLLEIWNRSMPEIHGTYVVDVI